MDTILIGIAGGSGSGKTTLANSLVNYFGEDEVSILRHDNYYKRHDEMSYEERSHLNYDHPDAFETDLLVEHLKKLRAGEAIDCPVYDYSMHNRSDKTVHINCSKDGDFDPYWKKLKRVSNIRFKVISNDELHFTYKNGKKNSTLVFGRSKTA